jgi:hypothetical protein
MKIEIREKCISEGHWVKNEYVVDGYQTTYRVYVDGKRVDSFLTRKRAEEEVARLESKALAQK